MPPSHFDCGLTCILKRGFCEIRMIRATSCRGICAVVHNAMMCMSKSPVDKSFGPFPAVPPSLPPGCVVAGQACHAAAAAEESRAKVSGAARRCESPELRLRRSAHPRPTPSSVSLWRSPSIDLAGLWTATTATATMLLIKRQRVSERAGAKPVFPYIRHAPGRRRDAGLGRPSSGRTRLLFLTGVPMYSKFATSHLFRRGCVHPAPGQGNLIRQLHISEDGGGPALGDTGGRRR